MDDSQNLLHRKFSDLIFVAVDLETTGVNARADHLVEIAAVKISRQQPRPINLFDTLVTVPPGRLKGSHIHGIESKDLEGAPSAEIALKYLASNAANRVLVAHNARFDLGFLQNSMYRGHLFDAPYICTMELFKLLGHSSARSSLSNACGRLGIDANPNHSALGDAMACGKLFQQLLKECVEQRSLKTLGDLCSLGNSQFTQSLEKPPIPTPNEIMSPKFETKLKPRQPGRSMPKSEFWSYVKLVFDVVKDGEVSDEELSEIEAIQQEQNLTNEEVRAAHATVFAEVIQRFTEDRFLDDREAAFLVKLREALKRAGWAPSS